MRFDIVLATGDRPVALGAGEDVLAVKTFSLNSHAAANRMAAGVLFEERCRSETGCSIAASH
jgi:hypothetical protein